MNVWAFTGNLGGDAETRYTAGGDAVVSFSVAVKAGYGKNESTTWVKCSLFGKRAESLAAHLTKGTLVGITGEASLREWEAKDGSKRTNLEVRVSDVTLLGGKRDATARDKPAEDRQPAKQPLAEVDDDIPF